MFTRYLGYRKRYTYTRETLEKVFPRRTFFYVTSTIDYYEQLNIGRPFGALDFQLQNRLASSADRVDTNGHRLLCIDLTVGSNVTRIIIYLYNDRQMTNRDIYTKYLAKVHTRMDKHSNNFVMSTGNFGTENY